MAINFPNSPSIGQVYEFGDYRYTYDGVKWTSVLKYGLAAAKIASETPPPNPEAGLMWFVPSTGESYIWYEDEDSGQWIEERPSIGAPFGDFGVYGTVAQIAAGQFKVGQKVTVLDRANAVFEIVSGGVANNVNILNSGNINTAIFLPEQVLNGHNIFWFGKDIIGDITQVLKDVIRLVRPTGPTSGGGSIYIPEGAWTVNETILVKGSTNITTSGIEVFGAGKGVTSVTKIGVDLGEGTVNAVFQLANEYSTLAFTNNYNITIRDMNISGGDYGIYSTNLSAGISIRDMLVSGTLVGISNGSIWQSIFERLDIRGATGFQMRSSGTSISLRSIFVRLSTNIAYDLQGTYCFGDTLAADACTGTIYSCKGRWSLSGVGIESPNMTTGFVVQNGHLQIDNATVFNLNTTNAGLIIFRADSGGTLQLNGCKVVADVNETPQVMAGNLFVHTSPSSNLSMSGILNIVDTWQTTQATQVSSSGTFVSNGIVGSTPFATRSGGQVILGCDTSSQSGFGPYLDKWNQTPYMRALGIVCNTGDHPTSRIDGGNLSFSRGGHKGDIWASSLPELVRGFGWIKVNESSLNEEVRNGVYKKIPYVDSGATVDRPTVRLVIGQTYFDTNVGRPIFWNGSSWVDSAGTVV